MPRRKAALVGFGLSVFLALNAVTWGQNGTGADEQLLRAAGLATDNNSLIQYFRNRALTDDERLAIEALVLKLDSEVYKERDQAMRELTLRGPAAVPFLKKEIARKMSLELVQRCEQALKKIENSQSPEHPAAAARLLAARGVPGAAEALLRYLPTVTDDWIEEEILACLGTLSAQPNEKAALTAALKDKQAPMRAAAVYALGRRGGMEERQLVRSFLTDADPLVRRRAAQSLTGKRAYLFIQDQAAGDATLLKNHALGTGQAALLGFLGKRTLKEDDLKRLRRLVAELGAPAFVVRNRASKQLVAEGPPALAFLRPALLDADAEVQRRASLCIEEIRRGPGPALPSAAVRELARSGKNKDQAPATTIDALLAYVPFADDDNVEEDVCTALTLLSVRSVNLDPRLAEALHDPMAARRGAAAHVLARVGTIEHQDALRKLLDDPVPGVRYRAAHGLLLAHDRTALPKMIALLKDMPAASAWQVEDVLGRLAGAGAPAEMIGEGTPEKRQKAVKAWQQWLAKSGSKVDLARLTEGEPYLGLLTVVEYDSPNGVPNGQVWEGGRDGKKNWTITNLQGPMDAQVLPNGHVLIAENSANRVTERDRAGAIKWEYRTPGNPITCQRLPNGNTFIATYNQVMEITPDQKQLYLQARGPQFHFFYARKNNNGKVVAITAQGSILRFDPIANKDYPTINVGPNGGWGSVEALPNGHFLVAVMGTGQVREIDANGAVFWTVTMPGAFRATRLPNGNTVVASMTTRLVAEFDRTGQKRWETTCGGRPWGVRYR